MRTKTIELDGRKINLFFSTWALMKIAAHCGGDLDGLSEWISEGGGMAGEMERLSILISDLANGAIIKENADIALGLADGEKRPLYPDDYFVACMSPADIIEYKNEIFAALNMGTDYEIPEGVTVEEKDADLAELEAAKRKNSEGAQT